MLSLKLGVPAALLLEEASPEKCHVPFASGVQHEVYSGQSHEYDYFEDDSYWHSQPSDWQRLQTPLGQLSRSHRTFDHKLGLRCDIVLTLSSPCDYGSAYTQPVLDVVHLKCALSAFLRAKTRSNGERVAMKGGLPSTD